MIVSDARRSEGQTIALEVHDLTVAYRDKPVIWGVDFALPERQLAAIVGPNGAGKSTLLKTIMGLITAASGQVRVYDQPLEAVRKEVAYVPQRESVDWDFPTNVLDVVMMGRYGQMGLFSRPGKADREAAMSALEKVGMAEFAKRQISQLSGGQQQRIFLARALAQEARLYLMDEPFAGVDAATEAAILELLQSLRAEGRTVLVVHHDLQTVADYFDYVLMINMRLIADGRMEETFTTENLQKTYGGRLNLLSEVAHLATRHSHILQAEKKPE
ncbi:MAG TPA: metal ABC transporter ATP-binding protein [Rhodothermales bacterium]|nr:manganese ABC transporter ATP-binding protein [Bacteroidota bacterium]HRK73018.1 metal ABC transporter ATP-binding protein [Rhodothermales bacterium]HRR08307.1 metal ABC transporter ATP-binding protein [Rhodothermales bacterium]